MEVGKSGCDGLHAIDAQANSISAQQVVKAAHEELLQLMRQRAEVMKRIGTVKQTIAGLANLFGDQVLGDDLLELIDRKPNGRQPGFTKACRRVLMEVRRPLGAREVCLELERYAPAILARHKDPLASVRSESAGGLWRGAQPEQRAGPARLGVDQRQRDAGGGDGLEEDGLRNGVFC